MQIFVAGVAVVIIGLMIFRAGWKFGPYFWGADRRSKYRTDLERHYWTEG